MAEADPKIELSVEDVARFLDDVGPDARCPLCSKDHFEAIVSGSGNKNSTPVVPIYNNTPEQITRQAIPTVVLMCANCGHLHLLSRLFIERWKTAKTASEAPQNG